MYGCFVRYKINHADCLMHGTVRQLYGSVYVADCKNIRQICPEIFINFNKFTVGFKYFRIFGKNRLSACSAKDNVRGEGLAV